VLPPRLGIESSVMPTRQSPARQTFFQSGMRSMEVFEPISELS
jgi:hypothetical protein